MLESTLLSLKFLSKEMRTHDILVMRFEKPAGFVFTVGQFVQFAVPFEGKNVMRSYSITSTPDKNYLEFCTKLIPGGKASDMFARAVVGQFYAVTAPKGVFVCTEPVSAPTVFIATGTGIAPILPLVTERLKESSAPVTLVFGLRSEADIFWDDEFKALASAFANFSYTLTLSQPAPGWQGSAGRVTEHVKKTMVDGAKYYICGSVEMVKDVRGMLLEAQVSAKNIHFEVY